MRQEDCGSLPVLRNGELVGIVTVRDMSSAAWPRGRIPKEISEPKSGRGTHARG